MSGPGWQTKGFGLNFRNAGALHGTEQGVDQKLQANMLRDALDYNGDPGHRGVADGATAAGFTTVSGFMPTWSACIAGDGALRCCRGPTVATAA